MIDEIRKVVDLQQLTDNFSVMRKQESTTYKKNEYISHIKKGTKEIVDTKCRFQMALWYFQIMDFFKFRRETIDIAMSNIDRYVSTTEGNYVLYDRNEYQLAAICSLILATKLEEPIALNFNLFSKLSQGFYVKKQIIDMEKKIISALEWRVCPPTTCSFLNHFLELFTLNNMPTSVKESILTLSQLQIDYAIKDYSFISYKPSSIALASIMNTVDVLRRSNSISDVAIQSFRRDIFNIAGIDSVDIFGICEVKEKLKKVISDISLQFYQQKDITYGAQMLVSYNSNQTGVEKNQVMLKHITVNIFVEPFEKAPDLELHMN